MLMKIKFKTSLLRLPCFRRWPQLLILKFIRPPLLPTLTGSDCILIRKTDAVAAATLDIHDTSQSLPSGFVSSTTRSLPPSASARSLSIRQVSRYQLMSLQMTASSSHCLVFQTSPIVITILHFVKTDSTCIKTTS